MDSTHRLLPTGSLLYVCASSSGATSSGGQEHRRIPTGSLSRSCMLQSISGNDTDTPKEYRRTGDTWGDH